MNLASAVKLLWLLLFAVPLAPRAGTPEETVTAFVAAWNEGAPAKSTAYVVGGKPDYDFAPIMKFMTGLKVTVGDLKSTIDGDKATIVTPVKVELPKQKEFAMTETINLKKVGDNWLIVPTDPKVDKETVVGTLALMATGASMFEEANKAAKKTACLSNIKQLALAVIMYVGDNDDKFNMNPAKVKAALMPYSKNESIWYCPTAPKTKVSYSLNSALFGKKDTQIKDPANTVMIYEGVKGQLDFRHDGYAAVGFADGHAKMINVEAAKKLNWKP